MHYIFGLPRWFGGKIIHLPIQEIQVWSMGWEDPLEEKMASHSSILDWKIPWVEEPGGLPSMGHKELDMTELLSTQAQIMFLVDWAFLEQTKLAFHKLIFLSSCLLLWYSPTKISLDCFSDLTSNYTSTKCLCWVTLDKIQSSLTLPYLLLVILLTSFNSQSL